MFGLSSMGRYSPVKNSYQNPIFLEYFELGTDFIYSTISVQEYILRQPDKSLFEHHHISEQTQNGLKDFLF